MKQHAVLKESISDLVDTINDPKEILVYKTVGGGWVKQFVPKGDLTTIPDNAVRPSIRFFKPEQRHEALEYWKEMEDDSWKEKLLENA